MTDTPFAIGLRHSVFRHGPTMFAFLTQSVRGVMLRPALADVPHTGPLLAGWCHVRNEFIRVQHLNHLVVDNATGLAMDMPNVVDSLPKPFTPELLKTTVANAVENGPMIMSSQSGGTVVPEGIGGEAEPDLSGSQQCFTSHEVLEFINNSGRTGMLEIETEHDGQQACQVLALETDLAGATMQRELLNDDQQPCTGRVVRDRQGWQLLLRRQCPDIDVLAIDHDDAAVLSRSIREAHDRSRARLIAVVSDDIDDQTRHRIAEVNPQAQLTRPYTVDDFCEDVETACARADESASTAELNSWTIQGHTAVHT